MDLKEWFIKITCKSHNSVIQYSKWTHRGVIQMTKQHCCLLSHDNCGLAGWYYVRRTYAEYIYSPTRYTM